MTITHFRKVSARLYTLLSGSDFLTLLIHPLIMGYSFLAPFPVLTLPVILASFSYCLICFCIAFSSFLTTLLCVHRLLAIARPFLLPDKKKTFRVVGVLGLFAAIATYLVTVISVEDGIPQWSSRRMVMLSPYPQKNYRDFRGILYRAMFAINAVVIVVVSVCAGIVLRGHRNLTTEQNRENLCHSLRTLLIMNAFYGVFTIYLLLNFVHVMAFGDIFGDCDDRWITLAYFIAYPLAPMTLSVFNPLLLIIRGTDIKKFVSTKSNHAVFVQ